MKTTNVRWLGYIALLLFAAACGPEVWRPNDSGQCSPRNPNNTEWIETPLFASTLAREDSPGAFGCLRVVWSEDQQHQGIPIKMLPDGTVLAKASDSDTYPKKPITLPQAIRSRGPRFTLFLFGSNFQPTDPSPEPSTPAGASALCQQTMARAEYQCSGAPGTECWVELSLRLTNAPDNSADVAPCTVAVNPKAKAEPAPEPPAPDDVEPTTPDDAAPEPPSPDDAGPEPPVEPVGPDQMPEPPPEPQRPDKPLPPVDGVRPDREPPEPICNDGETKKCQTGLLGICKNSAQTCINGAWEPCPKPPPQPERCDGIDNNCDGQIDDGNVCNKPGKCSPLPCVVTIAGPAPGNKNAAGFQNGAPAQARFNRPYAAWVDAAGSHVNSGSILVTDTNNHIIRQLHPSGYVSTYAGIKGQSGIGGPTLSTAKFKMPYGIALGPQNLLYIADRGNNMLREISPAGLITKYNPSSVFQEPVTLAFDPNSDTLIISDYGNKTLTKFTHFGNQRTTTTLKGTYPTVTGIAFLGVNKFLFVEHFTSDKDCIQLYDLTTNTTTVFTGLCNSEGNADGTATTAQFNDPRSVAINSKGEIYVFDEGSRRIRRVSPNGTVKSIAGTGNAGYTNGAADKAQFGDKVQLAIDIDDNVLIVDTENHAIRKLFIH